MSNVTRATAALTLAFAIACTGGDTPMAPAEIPAPATPAPPELARPAEPAAPEAPAPPEAPDEPAMPASAASGGAAGDHWCCQYDGPLGKTHDLIDNPATCAEKYADHAPEFVSSPECAPVCCKYAKDPADLSEGYVFEEVASGNCDMRKGTLIELEEGATCRDPDKPRAPVTRKAIRPTPPPQPTFRERMKNPHNPRSKK